ncbi:MAG: HAD family hydrolase [Phycisphaeraceae bacterium]
MASKQRGDLARLMPASGKTAVRVRAQSVARAAGGDGDPCPRPMDLGHIRALLIDIDDTVVRVRPEYRATHDTGSLMRVLERAGVELAGLDAAETRRRIEHIKQTTPWWHWSDFIVELGLPPRRFWDYAYEMERQYIEPTGPEIRSALERLAAAGLLLFVASNNPSSGILHKLRLAGLAQVHGCPLFSQLLGATELHAMKAQRLYWQKALAHIGMDGHETAVVGDSLADDYVVPQSAGIACSFIINRGADASEATGDGLIHVRSFADIAHHLLGISR